jgi:hypothetical protein
LTAGPPTVIITTPTLITPAQVVPSHWRNGGPIKLASDSPVSRKIPKSVWNALRRGQSWSVAGDFDTRSDLGFSGR